MQTLSSLVTVTVSVTVTGSSVDEPLMAQLITGPPSGWEQTWVLHTCYYKATKYVWTLANSGLLWYRFIWEYLYLILCFMHINFYFQKYRELWFSLEVVICAGGDVTEDWHLTTAPFLRGNVWNSKPFLFLFLKVEMCVVFVWSN